MRQEIKKRLSQAVNRSYFKPWTRRWWGIAIIIFLFFCAAAVIVLSYKVIDNFRHQRNGDYYIKETNTWITEKQFQDTQKEIVKSITDDDPWLGSDDPIIYVVAYEDFGCPFCKDNQEDIKQLIAKFGSIVRYVPKDFPIEGLHPNVMNAHLAAACANEQGKYWEYRDLLYDNQATEANPNNFSKDNLVSLAKKADLNNAQFKKCLDAETYLQEIKQDVAAGYNDKVVGTPSYVINGSMIPGEIKFAVWEKIVGFILKGQQ